MSVRLRYRKPSKWAVIDEPGPGARYRGYLRYSDRELNAPTDNELNAPTDKSTFVMQRTEIDAFARARGWVCAGWDEEPAISGAAEEIALRPAFQKHLDDAASGAFEVSLCFMTDRWARDTAIGLESLKRLRRAGVYWATADGRWDINKVIEDGHSVAFVVDSEINASYARKVSQKAIVARRLRAHAGYHNGRVTWGYRRAPAPPRPPDAPYNWRPPRAPAERHPVNFARLQQIGAWAAAGLSDREIAGRAAAAGWTLEHPHRGVVPWGKSFLAMLLRSPFPREFAPGSGHGTIITPDGERVEGKHVAAWSWDLWHRMDEARALNRKGTRGRAPARGVVRLFSGLARCAACGRLLHHQLRHGPVSGVFGVYLCASSDGGYPCPVRASGRIGSGERGARGWRGIRSSQLEEQFASLVLDWELPPDWREQIAAEVNRQAGDDPATLAEVAQWRTTLQDERKRVLTQHRFGRISDEEMLEETARIDGLLAALPTPEGRAAQREAQMTAAQTMTHVRDYWDHSTPEQRAEMLRLLLLPEGLMVDLTTTRIVRVHPRPAFLPFLRIVLDGPTGRFHEADDDDGWLIRR